MVMLTMVLFLPKILKVPDFECFSAVAEYASSVASPSLVFSERFS